MDYSTIDDEEKLHKILQRTEKFAERKKIRTRMKELREKATASYESRKETTTEDSVQMRKRQAEEDKRKKMEAFDKQAHEAKGHDASQDFLKAKLAAAQEEKERKLKDLTESGQIMAAAHHATNELIVMGKQAPDAGQAK